VIEGVRIAQADPYLEEARGLIAELDAYQSALYPAESNHLDSAEELASPHAIFVLAYWEECAVGCGAVKVMEGGYGEIKRLYVSPLVRGKGIAKAIMEHLESAIADQGVRLARLETGIHQEAAIRLYGQLGYTRIGPFGSYRPDPFSVFMEKRLG
jgi:putative acetyltransferase